jgi:hypothetical protein
MITFCQGNYQTHSFPTSPILPHEVAPVRLTIAHCTYYSFFVKCQHSLFAPLTDNPHFFYRYGSTYKALDAEQLDCSNPDNVDTIIDSINIYSEVFGDDSKCFETSTGEGRCYRAACLLEEQKLRINVRGTWLTCDYDFQELSVRLGSGLLSATVTCPRLSSACPDVFCPFNCAGRGVCNYGASANGTSQPQCECFDATDNSPGCSDSLIPDGGFLENGNGLFDNVEENFFDPLVAVFVDHPDKWTTSSWAWAAGLMAVFLIMLLCICSSFWPGQKKKVSGR